MGQVSLFRHGSSVGKVICVPIPGDISPFISITLYPPKGSDAISNNGRNRLSGIITSANIEKAENLALTPTLGKTLYMYVGGESAYKIDVSGVVVRNCNNDNNGFDQIISWYENANVKKTGKPCKLVFNSKVFKGYLRSITVSVNPKMDNTAMFSLSFYGLLA